MRRSLPVGQAGLSTLRLECGYSVVLGAVPDGRSRVLELVDANYAERIGWREITARGEGVELNTTLPTASASARLTAYPQDLLASPLDQRRAEVRVTPVGLAVDQAPPAEWPAAPATDGRPTDALASLISQAQLSLFGLAAALFLAFGLGILHALTPGHGKTVMAAYLVGTRGTRGQALVLGPVVALSHTAGVLLLGAITLSASRLIAPERLYPYLSTASGAIVLALGVILLARRIRGAHGRDHPHGHAHERPATTTAFGWRPLVALGLSGGVVPSASALLLLLGAIQFNRIGLGMILILAFGCGMAATLVTVGLALVLEREEDMALRRLGMLLHDDDAGDEHVAPVAAGFQIARAKHAASREVLAVKAHDLRPGRNTGDAIVECGPLLIADRRERRRGVRRQR